MSLFSLLIAGTSSGWFGPSNYDECVQAYATGAATQAILQSAARACAVAFDPTAHPILRARNLCYAKALPNAKIENAARLIYAGCEKENPDPSCPRGKQFSYELEACEWTCPGHQRYDRQRNACEWACPEGWAGDPATNMCMPPPRFDPSTARPIGGGNIFDPFAQPATRPIESTPSPIIRYESSENVSPPEKTSKARCQFDAVMSDEEVAACR